MQCCGMEYSIQSVVLINEELLCVLQESTAQKELEQHLLSRKPF